MQESATPESRQSFDREAAACRPGLLGYARHLTRCPAAADDLVQETLLRAMCSWRTFTPGTRMAPWLRTILYHLFANQYRSRRRRGDQPSLDADHPDPGPAWAPGHPEGALGRVLLKETIASALDRLSPEHREAVHLSDVAGFAYAEVAVLMGVPVGTAKSRLFRARRNLRDLLRQTAEEFGYGLAVAQGGGSVTRRAPSWLAARSSFPAAEGEPGGRQKNPVGSGVLEVEA